MTNIFQNVFFLYYLVMRYIVATGDGDPYYNGVKTEVVDLYDPSKSCILEDIPYRRYSAGGMLGTTPVICGGREYELDECLLYGTNNKITMNSKRQAHSSVALSDERIWILGGFNSYDGVLDSTEFVTKEGAVNNSTLPEAVQGHCSVKCNNLIYLIGGSTLSSYYGPTKNVWVANPSNGYAFVPGPSMMTDRVGHSCGTISIGTTSIIIAAGGYKSPNALSSVEILDPLSNQWVEGK